MSALIDESSNEESSQKDGSHPGKSSNIERYHEAGAARLYQDYVANNCIYPIHLFKRRFRESRDMLLRTVHRLEVTTPYFQQRPDCTERNGFSVLQKATCAIRQLDYGISTDSTDEYMRIGEPTELLPMKHFACEINEKFGIEYMRSPTAEEKKIVLKRSSTIGLPGILESIDCCKWLWKNCTTAHHGQYVGKEKILTVTLEAIVDDRIYFWHYIFGVTGCNNDRNVFNASDIAAKISKEDLPIPVEYVVDSNVLNKPFVQIGFTDDHQSFYRRYHTHSEKQNCTL